VNRDCQKQEVGGLCFAPDGSGLVIAGETELCVISLDGNQRSRLICQTGPTYSLALSPCGKQAAVHLRGMPGAVKLINLRTGKSLTAEARSEARSQIEYSRDGKEVYFIPWSGPVVALSATTGKKSRVIASDTGWWPRSAVSADRRWIV